MFFLILLVSAFGYLIYCSRKYDNPYKLIFIFGKKGAFKSTYMVSLMISHLLSGWNVYTNMPDVKIPGVRVFDSVSLATCVPDKHSVLFVDEGGLIWDNRGHKTFDKGYTEFFKLQRKYNCKMYINSQSFDIDKKIRDLVDHMVLMTSLFNCIGIVRPISRIVGLVDATANGESRVADNLKFKSIFSWKFLWGPTYFKYFNSFLAPERPPMPYSVVGGDLPKLPVKYRLKALNRQLDLEEEYDD